jgi:D-serine deaminase-like pyridoxal phosphate-dependent protein
LDLLPTPHLLVDLATVERNAQRLADYAARHRLAVRPHAKTHKSLALAQLQLKSGARGLTVAKVGEAKVMASVCDDLLIAYPALDHARTTAIADLARTASVRVAIDSQMAADALAAAVGAAHSTLGILIDLDLGMRRTGVQTPEASLHLARHVAQTPHLRLDGLFCYPGHVQRPPNQQGEQLTAASQLLDETLALWRRAGLPAPIVSGGSTPTAYQSHLMPSLTEIRPGTYLFNDANTLYGGFCTIDDCAAVIVATVMSNVIPGKVIIDAGSKTLTSDLNIHRRDSGYGYLPDYTDATITRLSEEHGELDVSRCQQPPRLGERVRVIPNHICPCVNLQSSLWLRDHEGQAHLLPVDARGLLS